MNLRQILNQARLGRQDLAVQNLANSGFSPRGIPLLVRAGLNAPNSYSPANGYSVRNMWRLFHQTLRSS